MAMYTPKSNLTFITYRDKIPPISKHHITFYDLVSSLKTEYQTKYLILF